MSFQNNLDKTNGFDDGDNSNIGENLESPKNKNTLTLHKQFSLRHVFRAGAIIWCKHRGKDYYVVFKSFSRPNRGVQIPGGRVEKYENVGQTILREVYEETGLRCEIVCPLGFIFFENKNDNYSNLQTYFIVKPIFPIDVFAKWKHIDRDQTKQDLECWCEPVEKNADFLAIGQDQIVEMFRKWLEDHKKPFPRKRNFNNKKADINQDLESEF